MLNLKEFKERLDASLREVYAQPIAKATAIDPLYGELVQEMADFILRGGKRLRPYLAYALYEGFQGSNLDAIIKVGTILEIFHNFLLIHDDIIDRDLVRYGGPNIEGTYFHRLHDQAAHSAEHGAQSAAILAGDIAHSLTTAITQTLPVSDAHKLRILRALTDALLVVGGGEFIDSLGSVLSHTPLSREQITAVYVNKTANYTFYLPFLMAAILTDQPAEIEQKLEAISVPIGLSFQLRDDYLGLFGDSAHTGKPITSDVREGKQTIFYALMQERCSKQDLVELEHLYGNASATERDVYRVREICTNCGAAALVEQQIQDYYTKAVALLADLPLTEASQQTMRVLFDRCANRTS